MSILYISGSPRTESNTDYLLELARGITGGEFFKLSDFEIAPCQSCWGCQNTYECVVADDMSEIFIPKFLKCRAAIIGSPVYFNNVSAQMKAFMDRTWCIRKQMKNRIGAAIVVGRRYGAESAITAIHSYFTKLEMIPANRGVCGVAFESGDIRKDTEAIAATRMLAKRVMELLEQIETPETVSEPE